MTTKANKKGSSKAKVTRPTRILFLSVAGAVGGAERSLYELLSALPEDQIEAHACVPPDSPLARMFALAEIPVYTVPLRRFRRTLQPIALAGQVKALYLASKSIRKLVKRLDIDVIHANTDSAALIAWEVHRETKCPFVWHSRDLRPLGPLAKLLTRSAAGVISISQTVAEHLRTQGVARKRIHCILNGIDLARFYKPEDRAAVRKRTREYLGIAPDTPLLIDIGAWVPWKRHELFLETLTQVRKESPKAMGLLVGSDLFQENEGYASFLDTKMDDWGLLDDALLVLQQRDDVPDLLAASDILVSTSDKEPFGRVLAEAQVAGLPVVSTNTGAKGEIVQDGVTGYLTDSKAESLSKACLKLIGHPKKIKMMGGAAQKHAQQKFNIKRTASDLADYLDQIVRK